MVLRFFLVLSIQLQFLIHKCNRLILMDLLIRSISLAVISNGRGWELFERDGRVSTLALMETLCIETRSMLSEILTSWRVREILIVIQWIDVFKKVIRTVIVYRIARFKVIPQSLLSSDTLDEVGYISLDLFILEHIIRISKDHLILVLLGDRQDIDASFHHIIINSIKICLVELVSFYVNENSPSWIDEWDDVFDVLGYKRIKFTYQNREKTSFFVI